MHEFLEARILKRVPPSPSKKRRRDMNGRGHGYMHICLFIPAACDLDFDALKLQSTVNLRVLVEKFTPRIVYVKSGVDFYAQTRSFHQKSHENCDR